MTKKQWVLVEITAAVLAIIVLAAVMVPKFLSANKNINTAGRIPDDNFRRIMAEYMPVEPDGFYTAEQAKEKSLAYGTFYLDGKEIHSLKGIEYFVGVTELYCSNNEIEEMDLSLNTNLNIINISGNTIKNLILPQSKFVTKLTAPNNQLSTLDLSSVPNIVQCRIAYNEIKDTDFTQNKDLLSIIAYNNKIEKLYLSHNAKLGMLYLQNNPLNELILPDHAELIHVHLTNTQLEQIPDLTPYTTLKVVDLRGIPIDDEGRKIIQVLEERMGKEVVLSEKIDAPGLFSGDMVESGVLYDGKDERFITIRRNTDINR